MIRLALMQLCPPLIKRLFLHTSAAISRSASSSMIYGSLPPSSSTVFFKHSAAVLATFLPAGSLPVRVTAFTKGWRINSSTSPDLMCRLVNSPFGKPLLSKISSMAAAQPGTFEACLSRPPLPAINAGAANRNTCQKGKFQGMTAKIIPRG